MSAYLLDTNLLIALLWPRHDKHPAAMKWFAGHRKRGWATCAMTQAGFVRIVSNPGFSRDAVRPVDAVAVLAANLAANDHVFWPDVVSYPEATAFAGVRLIGHQQVTDAYLLGLAVHHRGMLATLDTGVSSLTDAKGPYRHAIELVH